MRTTPAELVTRYRREGWWDGTTLTQLVASSFEQHRNRRVVVHSKDRPFRGTVADILAAGHAFARALHARGVRASDTVAFQLPNWAESLACFTGIALSGATTVPIAPYYAAKEIEFILDRSRARVLVIAHRFRGRDHLAELEALRARLPALEHVVVVSDERLPSGMSTFADLVAGGGVAPTATVDPEAVAAMAWTSGTTSDPKGVLLSQQALAFEVRHHMAAVLPAGRPRLCGAPLSHVTGMLAAALVPAYRGDDLHVTDQWDPPAVLRTLLDEDISPGLYAPVFATSLIKEPSFGPKHQALMESASMGGSPVPPQLVAELEALGIPVTRGFGCTEHPSISVSVAADLLPWRTDFDGPVLRGVEVLLVDDDGNEVPDGAPGEILSRGPDMFSGYLDDALTDGVLDADGWFHTGDIGIQERQDRRAWLRIVDRKKDIIIRGGINISPAEIESAVASLPGIIEVAVLGLPDVRLGERACVVVRPAAGSPAPTLDAINRHLASVGMAKQKWPERLVVTHAELPRTPSGKVRKRDVHIPAD